MSKRIALTTLLALIIVLILALRIYNKEKGEIEARTIEGIDRAHAAKMIATLGFAYDEMSELAVPDNYTDVKKENWYYRYFAATTAMGIIWGDSAIKPSDYLTYKECRYILECMYLDSDNTIKKCFKGLNENEMQQFIPKEEWLAIYGKMMKGEFGGNPRTINEEELMLLSVMDSSVNEWKVATDKGAYHFDGFALDTYTNGTISVLTDGNDIVYIKGFVEGPCVINNAWIISGDSKTVSMYYSGIVTNMKCGEGVIAQDNKIEQLIADLIIEKGSVMSLLPKSDRRNEAVVAFEEGCIEGAVSGKLAPAENMKVYGMAGDNIRDLNTSDIPVGNNMTDIIVGSDGRLEAVIVNEDAAPTTTIRVALTTTDYKSHFHKKVVLNSDMGMTISVNGAVVNVAAGEKIVYRKDDANLAMGRIKITAPDNGHIIVNNIKRSYGKPMYRGSIELALYKKGIVIVNELPVDWYLYSVVPSEMPSSYGVEALKVQAVCARSYAFMHIKKGALANIGAHVDDSTSYQVYNNTHETAESVEAVNQTTGQVLTYEGKIIPAYYYSTSCGVSSNGKDVWFGLKNTPYLTSSLQCPDTDLKSLGMDLSDDGQFKQFLDRNDIKTYDEKYPWYRWETKVSAEEVKKSLDKYLESRYKVNPSLILTKNEKGIYVSEPVSSIGDVLSVKSDNRAESGLLNSIIIEGSEKTIKIKSEYNIRLVLAPHSSTIKRKDGSIINKLALLPSAFAVITELKDEENICFCIKGGGYGHGVGMSQNGSRSLVENGLNYADVLKHYYQGCEITSVTSAGM